MRPARPIRIEGEVAFIPLTKGAEAIIDATDVPVVSGRNWCARVTPRSVYAQGRMPNGRGVALHRFLLDPPAGTEVDHINGDGLDNRRANLRLATHAENGRNRRRDTRSSSGLKGVRFHTQRRKWQARITVGGKAMSLGIYPTREAAHEAYCAAAARLHGQFWRGE